MSVDGLLVRLVASLNLDHIHHLTNGAHVRFFQKTLNHLYLTRRKRGTGEFRFAVQGAAFLLELTDVFEIGELQPSTTTGCAQSLLAMLTRSRGSSDMFALTITSPRSFMMKLFSCTRMGPFSPMRG